jgi:hypothetical protein
MLISTLLSLPLSFPLRLALAMNALYRIHARLGKAAAQGASAHCLSGAE